MPLQWGRGLGTAESGYARGHSVASPLASMGPRSWDRGEVVACVKAPLMRTGLQWGRGLGTAERRWLIAPQTADGQASMGPRSWDRGEESVIRYSVHFGRGFNGAAVLGPRRAGP